MRTGERLQFREPARGRALAGRLRALVDEIGRSPISVMHVCGSHEQAIARFGLRSALPPALDVIMGPGCPVCVTDAPEVDEAVALARRGVRVATYGDMLRVPGSSASLGSVQAEGGRVDVVYSVSQAVELAATHPDEEVVFFASGFETTAVTTAAAILKGTPTNFSVLSAHKYVPPAMAAVSAMPGTRIEGYLAAGHAATITGWAIFEPLAAQFDVPVVVAGFEPLDILAALVRVVELIRDGEAKVENLYPRCVTREGNRRALSQMWEVFEPRSGHWRGIAEIPDGNLRLRDAWRQVDARHRFDLSDAVVLDGSADDLAAQCVCGDIMAGLKKPTDCALFGEACRPESPVGACMVSSEGTCKIWQQYGGRPDLGASP